MGRFVVEVVVEGSVEGSVEGNVEGNVETPRRGRMLSDVMVRPDLDADTLTAAAAACVRVAEIAGQRHRGGRVSQTAACPIAARWWEMVGLTDVDRC